MGESDQTRGQEVERRKRDGWGLGNRGGKRKEEEMKMTTKQDSKCHNRTLDIDNDETKTYINTCLERHEKVLPETT